MVARPIRCFKKLDSESEVQERWIWLNMLTKQLHWSKKNPIEGGDDHPAAVPPPINPAAMAEVQPVAVVEVADAAAKAAGSKALLVHEFAGENGYVTHFHCKDNCSLPEKEGKFAQLLLSLDPKRTPKSILSAGKSILTSRAPRAVVLYVPHDTNATRKGSAFYYVNVMRNLAMDVHNIYDFDSASASSTV